MAAAVGTVGVHSSGRLWIGTTSVTLRGRPDPRCTQEDRSLAHRGHGPRCVAEDARALHTARAVALRGRRHPSRRRRTAGRRWLGALRETAEPEVEGVQVDGLLRRASPRRGKAVPTGPLDHRPEPARGTRRPLLRTRGRWLTVGYSS